jgi:hypothetical protein
LLNTAIEEAVDRKRKIASEQQTQGAERNPHSKNMDRTKAKITRCEQDLSDWKSRWTAFSNQTVISEPSTEPAKESIPLIRKLIETNSRKKEATQKLKNSLSR